MESFRTDAPQVSLPPGVPERVRLLNEVWLHEQTSRGAKLALVDPEPDEVVAQYEQRLRDLAFRLGAAQLEVDELKRTLEAAQRPFWKQLFLRG